MLILDNIIILAFNLRGLKDHRDLKDLKVLHPTREFNTIETTQELHLHKAMLTGHITSLKLEIGTISILER